MRQDFLLRECLKRHQKNKMKRRYIFNKKLYSKNPEKITKSYDVAVVGGGMAGLFAALEIDKSKKIALIIKGNLEGGSSYLAQGGICCVLDEKDSFEAHIKDTLSAGAGHCDEKAVEVMVCEGPENIKRLIGYGVEFDKNNDGSLKLTREGGHSARRILHCGGDATGKEITKALGKACEGRENIDILWNTDLVDILTDENGVCGIVANDKCDDFIIKTANVLVATGGAGQLYRYSTTPVGNTGEGIAACLRAGCKLSDMEFVQFHPTAFAIHEEGERLFLISEAVRGEGAILKNKYGEAFMSREGNHPLADLAPRDIVTRAIIDEMKRSDDTKVYLDTSAMTTEFFEKRFPTITKKCREHGITPSKDLIPVHPTQHYLMGGVSTDLHGKTNIEGLFVCGEAACTGVHGANRLASNSTLECIVFAKRAADYINSNFRTVKNEPSLGKEPYYTVSPADAEMTEDMNKLKEIMTEKVGAVRKLSELKIARSLISDLKLKYSDCNFENEKGYTLYSAIDTALVVIESALERTKSIGSHYIQD